MTKPLREIILMITWHSQNRLRPGWRACQFWALASDGIFQHAASTPSQGIFRVESKELTDTVWLTESPKPVLERVVGDHRISQVDPEFRQFFTKKSLMGGQLLHQQYRSIKTVVRVPRKELGFVEQAEMLTRLDIRTSENTALVIDEHLEAEDKFAFIYRAKYRA